ncbi:MAG: OmpA family protein [Bacteroidales bacterium]|nr:OmpA family protein [Bacteroidales bacterium]
MKRVLLSLFAILLVSLSFAQTVERLTDYEDNLFGKKVYVSSDYETLKAVRRLWTQESIRLRSSNYEFAQCGNSDAVLKVTIPSRLLFQQGDSVLSQTADGILRPFLRMLRGDQAVATLVIACYSDNNGSEKYLNHITTLRANAIARWVQKQGMSARDVSAYGMANNVPKTDNSSLAKRERNRRVTLYLVPNRRMLRNIKRGSLFN